MVNLNSIAPRGWYILCLSSQVKHKPKQLFFSDVALVAFRTEGGKIGVLRDQCSHRGVPLSQGIVVGNSVQCPYHGWQYDIRGAVTRIPALEHCLKTPQTQCVHSFCAVEQQGFIWIRVGEAENILNAPRFANFGVPGWSTFTMQTRFTGTVESCLENFLDCPHATFVHRYWFRAPTKQKTKAVVTTLDDGAQAEYFEEPRKQSAVWWFLAPRTGAMQHIDRFIAPNLSRVDYKFNSGLHYIITSSCTPLNKRETLVHTVITFRYKYIGFLVRLFFEPLSRWIIRQDVKMLALQQKNLEASALAGNPLQFESTQADLLGAHVVNWRKSLQQGIAPPPSGKVYQVDLTL
jgi:phenylpropionate dioxygenase-like ring-hydroxylating dioxygenase large terminal subunit